MLLMILLIERLKSVRPKSEYHSLSIDKSTEIIVVLMNRFETH